MASRDFASEKFELLNLSLGGATYFIHLFNIDLSDVFRMTQCLVCQKSCKLVKAF